MALILTAAAAHAGWARAAAWAHLGRVRVCESAKSWSGGSVEAQLYSMNSTAAGAPAQVEGLPPRRSCALPWPFRRR
eukprot:scaffold272067_cov28-Tisochrysis_lutea.AAC.4